MKYFEKLVKPLEQLGYKLYVADASINSLPDIRTIVSNSVGNCYNSFIYFSFS